jgi:hypothetical protein
MAWAGAINYEKSFVIRNAYELLDSPGNFTLTEKQKHFTITAMAKICQPSAWLPNS